MAGKQSFPVAASVEFRGLAAAGEFTDRETGEVVAYPAKLKLEREDMDGDVMLYEVSANADRVQLDVDPKSLKKGDRLVLEGEVVVYAERPGYFRPARIRRDEGKIRPVRESAQAA